jgi:hypothetical protein
MRPATVTRRIRQTSCWPPGTRPHRPNKQGPRLDHHRSLHRGLDADPDEGYSFPYDARKTRTWTLLIKSQLPCQIELADLRVVRVLCYISSHPPTSLRVSHVSCEVQCRSPKKANRPLRMGHSPLAVLERYLALAREDIERAHKVHSPVDNLLWTYQHRRPRVMAGRVG